MSIVQEIKRYLMHRGPATALTLANALDISQPQFSRALSQSSDSDLLRVGAARSTQYALLRRIESVEVPIPVYEIGETANSTLLGNLFPVHPSSFYFASDIKSLERFYDSLPFFLNDMRPSGFLGRLIPRHHPELAFPKDVRNWSDEHCLRYLSEFGSETIGNLVLGDKSFQKTVFESNLEQSIGIGEDRALSYSKIAEDVLHLALPGSSAAGEQPKFLVRGLENFLVKFSPPISNEIGQRRSDLLVCEHLALQSLAELGKNVPRTEVVRSENRTFLQLSRFDRLNNGGRRGIISLFSLDAEFVGDLSSWEKTVRALVELKLLGASDLEEVIWRAAFGEIIANTDMHHGNLSFYFEQGKLNSLTPIYDMLPMAYAPRNEQITDFNYVVPTPHPREAATWRAVWKAGIDYWGKVADEPMISQQFRQIAAENRAVLKESEKVLDRLPS